MKTHWLDRPGAVRRVKLISAIALIATVLAQLVVAAATHFPIEGWFGFAAVFGFAACAVMIGFAKLLGVFLKRPDDYYGDPRD